MQVPVACVAHWKMDQSIESFSSSMNILLATLVATNAYNDDVARHLMTPHVKGLKLKGRSTMSSRR